MVEECTGPFPVSVVRRLMKSFGSLRAMRYSTAGKKKEVSLRTWMVKLAEQPGKQARGGVEMRMCMSLFTETQCRPGASLPGVGFWRRHVYFYLLL